MDKIFILFKHGVPWSGSRNIHAFDTERRATAVIKREANLIARENVRRFGLRLESPEWEAKKQELYEEAMSYFSIETFVREV